MLGSKLKTRDSLVSSKLTDKHNYIESLYGTTFYTFYLFLGLASFLENIIIVMVAMSRIDESTFTARHLSPILASFLALTLFSATSVAPSITDPTNTIT